MAEGGGDMKMHHSVEVFLWVTFMSLKMFYMYLAINSVNLGKILKAYFVRDALHFSNC